MKRRLLVAYSAKATFVQTTFEYLEALRRLEGFDTHYVDIAHQWPFPVDLEAYDAVLQNYCARWVVDDYISETYSRNLATFGGLKILAVQDEYEQTNRIRRAILDHGFDIVLTAVPQAQMDYVYPRQDFGHVRFITVLTGYAPSNAGDMVAPFPLAKRPIDLGYRGRDLGGRFGRLAFDKYEIGRRMREESNARGIAHDIAMDEDSRIYGSAWYDFIGRCKAMLGSESGSNVFDFDGSLEAAYKMMSETAGRRPTYDEFGPIIGDREAHIDMGQISPRVFECAAMRTPMVLFRGRYSDAVKPDEHYIPLEKDFSNVGEVFERLADLPALEAIAERAYRHLIRSDRYSYAAFGEMVATAISERLTLPAKTGNAPATSGVPLGLVDDEIAVLPSKAPHTGTETELVAAWANRNAEAQMVELLAGALDQTCAARIARLDQLERIAIMVIPINRAKRRRTISGIRARIVDTGSAAWNADAHEIQRKNSVARVEGALSAGDAAAALAAVDEAAGFEAAAAARLSGAIQRIDEIVSASLPGIMPRPLLILYRAAGKLRRLFR